MIMMAKRKLTSGVALLCAFMILIGIFPMNLFGGGNVQAVSDAKYQNGYIYFDISGIVNSNVVPKEIKEKWKKNIYCFKRLWNNFGTPINNPPPLDKITDTLYGFDVSSWGSGRDTSGNLIFMPSFNWSEINNDNYMRTDEVQLNIETAINKIIKCNGDFSNINSKIVFSTEYSEAPIGEYIEAQTIAGKPINFKDMTGKLTINNVKAIFSGDGLQDKEVIYNNNNGFIVPDDVDGKAYTTVEFKNGVSLGKYNLFNKSGTGIENVEYDENTCNTFYYGATKYLSDNSFISYWGKAPSNENVSIANKKLYFENLTFITNKVATIKFGNGISQELVKDSNDSSIYSVTVPNGVTTQTIITVTYDNKEYHFYASDDENNLITVSDDIANVSEFYVKTNTVYFDATLSKLSYSKTVNDNIDYSLPRTSETIAAHAWNNDTDYQDLILSELTPVKRNGHTWSNFYKANLNKKYKNIMFYSIPKNTNAPNYSSSPDNSSARTADLTIDWSKYNNPCFYADTSDDAIYNGVKRSGYWDEVYTIRDAEKGKNSDVVDISNSEKFVKDDNTLYINSTFYDYYSDYELNGNNRDAYGGDNSGSHRNYTNFRQFDQALSDYYKANDVSINDAIYTGHFQPHIYSPAFSLIAGTLNLHSWSNYNTFISNNNSMIDSNGATSDGKSATQGIVNERLQNGVLKTHDGKAASPYFDESFLAGDNSKNTKLGEVYKNVPFPFTQQDVNNNGVNYWVFDSSKTTLAMRQDNATSNYYLKTFDTNNSRWSRNVDSGSKDLNVQGLFPFNETAVPASAKNYNYGFGTKLEFKFRLTSTGTVKDKNQQDVPIEFKFSGDDDVWIFVDDQLVLDIGGSHGKVDGEINFMDLTSKVSSVKKSANQDISGKNISSESLKRVLNNSMVDGKPAKDNNMSDEHTLTMFYMERGLWESNMKVQFNFPDENKLEVQKVVDTSKVNNSFVDFFNDVSLFTFDIKNLATHYGPKDVVISGEQADPITFSDFNSGNGKVTLQKGVYCDFEHKDNYTDKNNATKNNIIRWYAAEYNDLKGDNTVKRTGTVKLDSAIDISPMEHLSFDICIPNHDIQIGGIYIQLTDSNGKKATAYLNANMLNGTPITQKNTWSTFKVILSKLKYDSAFDKQNVASIGFQYDQVDDSRFWSDVYLDNFIFEPATVLSGLTGFVVNQDQIPDYGTAKDSKLKAPIGAEYQSSVKEPNRIGTSGTFTLQNKEIVTFYDQFRRGSYIYLNERLTNAQKLLFDTKYTMYENDIPVTAFDNADVKTVSGASKNLQDVICTSGSGQDVSLDARVDDGRTEKKGNAELQVNNNYNGSKPEEPTFVFRSYSEPDLVQSSTKLKVVYTNSVKTSDVTITKKQKKIGNQPDLQGKYKFYVEFTNVGGIGLVKQDGTDSVIVGPIELGVGESEVIKGVPVGTEYKIHEVVSRQTEGVTTSVPDSILGYVTQTQPTVENNVQFKHDSLKVSDGEVYSTWAVNSSVSYDAIAFSYDFNNMYMPTVSLNIKKVWDLQDDIQAELPDVIRLKLQRYNEEKKDNNIIGWEDVPNRGIISLTASDIVNHTSWMKEINDLNKYVDSSKLTINPDESVDDSSAKKWKYRIVELDSNGNVIEDGGIYNEKFTTTYDKPNGTEIDNDTLTVTNTLKKKYSINITKVETGNTNKTLSGAVFELYDKNPNTTSDPKPIAVSEATGENGKITFKDLDNKKYWIKEKTAPLGYQINNNAVEADLSKLPTDTFEMAVQFENSPIVMPDAGGDGNPPNPFKFVLFGAIAIALAGGVLLLNKKYAFFPKTQSSNKEVQ